MCTAATYQTKDHYFGRNLDHECSYGEIVTVTPRNFPFRFRNMPQMDRHYAMIGMAFVTEGCPLYYDATNEKGLSMAGLNFVGNAVYRQKEEGKDNVASFEFIPWILGQCESLQEARKLLENLNLTDECFNAQIPPAQLHWIISDKESSITVEQTASGLWVYDNPIGILTNNPTFDLQMFQLNNYMALSVEEPENHFANELPLAKYCRGMGALGMPGDLSSMSRFVRAAFTKLHSCSGDSESESISQFFHILTAVEQQRGCVHLGDEKYEITVYSSCCNTDKGIYYYRTYENSQITAVDMQKENLEGTEIVSYPLVKGQQIMVQNEKD